MLRIKADRIHIWMKADIIQGIKADRILGIKADRMLGKNARN